MPQTYQLIYPLVLESEMRVCITIQKISHDIPETWSTMMEHVSKKPVRMLSISSGYDNQTRSYASLNGPVGVVLSLNTMRSPLKALSPCTVLRGVVL